MLEAAHSRKPQLRRALKALVAKEHGCHSASAVPDALALLGCGSDGITPPYRAVWGPGANDGLINSSFGTVEGSLMVDTATNKATLYGNDRNGGGGGWWRWSGF